MILLCHLNKKSKLKLNISRLHEFTRECRYCHLCHDSSDNVGSTSLGGWMACVGSVWSRPHSILHSVSPASALAGAGRGFYRSQPPRMVPSPRSRRWLACCPQQRPLICRYGPVWSPRDGCSIGAESNSAEPSSVWRDPAETDVTWQGWSPIITSSAEKCDTSAVTSDHHGQHPHSGAQPGAHSVRLVFDVIISWKYEMLCRSHARESARMCCNGVVLGLAV